MAKLNDEELYRLQLERRELLMKGNRHEISEEECNKLEKILSEKIDSRVKILLDSILNKNKNVQLEVENKMAEEKPKKEEKKEEKKVGKRENSNAQLILKALQMKSVKTADDVVKKVKEWKPTIIDSRVKAQTGVMIKEIENGKGSKAKKYKWNAEEYLLVPIEE